MSEQQRESRREFLRQAGTVAWATPFILTLSASPAHAQVSCAPAGSPCGTWSTPLQMCLPTNPAAMCCDSCERGTSEDAMFCFCS